MWTCANCRTRNSDADQQCCACGKHKDFLPIDNTQSNAARLNQKSTKHDNKFKVSGTTGKSLGASICTVCAVIIWIVFGIYGLVLIGRDGVAGLVVLVAGAITGLGIMATAEVFQNIADIAASLRSMSITQTEYRD